MTYELFHSNLPWYTAMFAGVGAVLVVGWLAGRRAS